LSKRGASLSACASLTSRKSVHYLGAARQSGSSHAIFKTPWPGDPRVNIQDAKGKAKPYQVRQVLQAIEKLEGRSDES